jgi:uncharacterized lipoprotein YbaY
MKTLRLFLPLACAALLAGAGCSSVSLDLRPEGDPSRVLKGTVNFRSEQPLPPDAEVVVRVIDMASVEAARTDARRDLPVAARARVEPPPTILAEQKVPVVPGQSLPFRLEFTATDELLRHGLNIEARISSRGNLLFRTVNAQVITLTTVARDPYEVWVMAAGR